MMRAKVKVLNCLKSMKYKTNSCNGTIEVIKTFNQKLYVTKELVFMLLDNAVNSVSVSNVIKNKCDNDTLKCVVCKT